MAHIEERRVSPRARFTGIAFVRSAALDLPCIAENVSETGMLIFPQRPAPPLPRVHLTFTLPNLDHWISVEGRVVRQAVVNRRVGLGIQFTHITPSVRRLLQTYVMQSRQAPAHGGPARETVKAVPTPKARASGTPPAAKRLLAAEGRKSASSIESGSQKGRSGPRAAPKAGPRPAAPEATRRADPAELSELRARLKDHAPRPR